MKLELKDIPAKLIPIINKLRSYLSFIFVLVVLALFAFVILRIRTLVTTEPSQDAVNERLLTGQPVKIDTEAVERIEKLEESNVEVRTLFKQARDNPFEE